jgi:hypothetical protein
MRRVPAGCQAVSLCGAHWQWCAWFINRATAVNRSPCKCAVVLTNKAEQRAILTPDRRHYTGQFAESPRLGGQDSRCLLSELISRSTWTHGYATRALKMWPINTPVIGLKYR